MHNQLKGIIYTKWHPGCSISSLSKQLLIFQIKCCHFPCRLCPCTLKLPCYSCSLCKQNIYPHAWRPEMPVAYEVAMATARCTQACFHAAGTHAVLRPQGECWESEVEGQGWRGHKPGINSVKWTASTVDKDVSLRACRWKWGNKYKQKIAATAGDVKHKNREKVLRDSVWVGGLRGPMQNLCIKLLKNELLTPAKKILDQNSFNACLVFFPSQQFYQQTQ